jgi:hypothetical protein
MPNHQLNEQYAMQEFSILDEFSASSPQKGWVYHLLTIISALYIGLLLLDFTFDLKSGSAKRIDWQVILVVLVLPSLGFAFHLARKKAGWIINCFYYLLIGLLSFAGFLRGFFRDNAQFEINWRGVLILACSLLSTVFLLSGPVRRYFNVGVVLTIFVPAVATALAAVMAISIFS